MDNKKPLIHDYNLHEIGTIVRSINQPDFRAAQIWQGLYQQLWTKPEQFSSLPKEIRNLLHEEYCFFSLETINTIESFDGSTIKSLFQLRDGKSIETVLMKYKQRRTLCISTQVGCSAGCVFCATGQMGFKRNLSVGEIIEQVIYYSNILKFSNEKLTNIVIMGMGEPFLNYDRTMKVIDILNNDKGYNFGARRFTISTVGIVPGIRRFTSEKRQVNLAVSLHSIDEKSRNSLIPINKKYPLSELADACLEYVIQTKRRISFEWAVINGVNDSVKDALELANWLLKFKIGNTNYSHVNLIPLNPTEGYQGTRSSREKVELFKDTITQKGISCTVRLRRGIDVYAGCGQLSTYNLNDR